MAQVTKAAVQEFIQKFQACAKRVGGGRVEVDTKALKTLIVGAKDAAAAFVEVYCTAAESNPALYQGAMMVATGYMVEFSDDRLVTMVIERAKASGATDWLAKIGIGAP